MVYKIFQTIQVLGSSWAEPSYYKLNIEQITTCDQKAYGLLFSSTHSHGYFQQLFDTYSGKGCGSEMNFQHGKWEVAEPCKSREVPLASAMLCILSFSLQFFAATVGGAVTYPRPCLASLLAIGISMENTKHHNLELDCVVVGSGRVNFIFLKLVLYGLVKFIRFYDSK